MHVVLRTSLQGVEGVVSRRKSRFPYSLDHWNSGKRLLRETACNAGTVQLEDCFQLGKGFLLESRKSTIKSRILERRSYIVSTSRSKPSESQSYHSGGMHSAQRHTSSTSASSALVSTGSNESHPVTPA